MTMSIRHPVIVAEAKFLLTVLSVLISNNPSKSKLHLSIVQLCIVNSV